MFWVANDRQNTSSSSVKSSNTFNKNINKQSITSAKWGQQLAISWRLYTNLQNKRMCWLGFFARTYKTNHTTNGSLLLRDSNVLFRKVCLDWKLSSIIKRWGRGDWNKNNDQILHIQINLDSKFQLQQIILIFGTNFKKVCFGWKQKKWTSLLNSSYSN